jgi:hypothetical protein
MPGYLPEMDYRTQIQYPVLAAIAIVNNGAMIRLKKFWPPT